MLPTTIQFICLKGYRGDAILEIDLSETKIVCCGHVC
jgi:hypothetical protein